MKDRDNIEELFNDAFSGWEPEVPHAVKASIDEKLFNQKKRGFFQRFRWVLLLLLLVGIALPAYYYFGENDPISVNQKSSTSNTPNSNQPNSESLNSTRNPKNSSSKENKGIQKVASDETPKSGENDFENDSENEDSNPEVKANQSSRKLPDSKKVESQDDLLASSKTKKIQKINPRKSTSKTHPTIPKESTPKTQNNNDSNSSETVGSSFSTESQSSEAIDSEQISREGTNQESRDLAKEQERLESKITTNNGQDSTSMKNAEVADSIPQLAIIGDSPQIQQEQAFKKSLLIGANAGMHIGRNQLTNNLGAFEENRNTAFGLDLSYHFKPKSMVSTGFMYQQRRENFAENIQQIDSVLLFSEPIFEEIIDTVNNDTTTVIIGYNDFYDYDTTQVNVSTDAVVRLMMLPLAYNFRIFGWKNHEFWLGTGVNLGLYRVSGSIQQTNQTWVQNQFAMQVFLRPSYHLAFGKWRAGVYGNFVYDVILPQTWSMDRRRWQMGAGFQVLYRIGKD
jgi:hypothetical protein